jgi:hypothetical protein
MSTSMNEGDEVPRGIGRAIFAGVLLLIAGTLNVIYGIAAIDNANFFVANAHYVAGDLNTWGWVTLCLGVLQFLAAFSVWRGGLYGLFFGIVMGGLAAIAALMSIPAYPFWSLALFALSILIIAGLVQYTSDMRSYEA